MKRITTLVLLFVTALVFTVSAHDNATITINEPTNNSMHLTDDVLIRVTANHEGTLKYRIDSRSEIVVCSNCSSFQTTLINLSNKQYKLTVTGIFHGNISIEKVVFFTVNKQNTTTTTINHTTTTIGNVSGKPIFTLGFNKLPKEFEAGQVSDSELLDIINNNKLNPGIINRLAKTRMLNPEHIDALSETQFLPSGIFKKLLGLIGFGKNRAFHSIVDNYNLTDTQLSSLIRNSELPPKSTKYIATARKVGRKSIASMVAKQDLSQSTVNALLENQDLTQEDLDRLMRNSKISNNLKQRIMEHKPIVNNKQNNLERTIPQIQTEKQNQGQIKKQGQVENRDNKGSSHDRKQLSIGRQKNK